MTSAADSVSGDQRSDEQPQKQASQKDQQEAPATSVGSQTTVGTPSTDYVTPYGHQEACHAMGQIAYPNIDPYYGSLYAAYGGQPMVSSYYKVWLYAEYTVSLSVVGIYMPTLNIPIEAVHRRPSSS